MTASEYVLGVDGGGSTTIAWLSPCHEQDSVVPLGVGQAGPSNPRIVGFETASRNVNLAIEMAFVAAGVSRCQVQAICLAIAGSDRQDEREQWQAWGVTHRIADERPIITNDGVPVIYAACAAGVGVALISGTGSLALGRIASGETVRSGGWGPLIGDEGSGYAIALSGLRAAVRSADGRAEATQLLPRFCDALGVTETQQIIPILYRDSFDRPKIASLASIVFDAAAASDPVADSIIRSAAAELAAMVSSVAEQTELPTHKLTLAGTGGVLLNQPAFFRQITDRLAQANRSFKQTQLVPAPVSGAVQIAINAVT